MRCFDDGRLALDNNPAERALRCVAIGRKNYLLPAPMPAAVAPPLELARSPNAYFALSYRDAIDMIFPAAEGRRRNVGLFSGG